MPSLGSFLKQRIQACIACDYCKFLFAFIQSCWLRFQVGHKRSCTVELFSHFSEIILIMWLLLVPYLKTYFNKTRKGCGIWDRSRLERRLLDTPQPTLFFLPPNWCCCGRSTLKLLKQVAVISRISPRKIFRESAIWRISKSYSKGKTSARPSHSHTVWGGKFVRHFWLQLYENAAW